MPVDGTGHLAYIGSASSLPLKSCGSEHHPALTSASQDPEDYGLNLKMMQDCCWNHSVLL
jgi:hypothetical protein